MTQACLIFPSCLSNVKSGLDGYTQIGESLTQEGISELNLFIKQAADLVFPIIIKQSDLQEIHEKTSRLYDRVTTLMEDSPLLKKTQRKLETFIANPLFTKQPKERDLKRITELLDSRMNSEEYIALELRSYFRTSVDFYTSKESPFFDIEYREVVEKLLKKIKSRIIDHWHYQRIFTEIELYVKLYTILADQALEKKNDLPVMCASSSSEEGLRILEEERYSQIPVKKIDVLIKSNPDITAVRFRYQSMLDVSILSLAVYCTKLQEVFLNCHGLSVASLKLLVLRNPQLRKIHFRDLGKMHDGIIETVSGACPLLTEISFGGDVTDSGIETLVQNCPNLETVYFDVCWGITDQAANILAQKCQHLKRVIFIACSFVTDAGKKVLLENHPNLEVCTV